jgi:hypothetical protein
VYAALEGDPSVVTEMHVDDDGDNAES